MRAAWLLILGLAAACSNTNVVVCDLDRFAQADVNGRPNIVNCGDALDNPDAGASNPWLAAQQCALDAVNHRRGFILLFDVPDPSGAQALRAGFTAYPTGNNNLIVHAWGFSARLPGDTSPTVSETTCNLVPELKDTNANASTPCTPGPGNVCLTCNHSTGGTLLCGFQP